MAMNLRMDEDLAAALRALADETGRSQQDLAREAVASYVREFRLRAYPPDVRHLITPARRRFRPIPASERTPVPPDWDSAEDMRQDRDRR